MRVKRLIEILKKCDPDMRIVTHANGHSNGCHEKKNDYIKVGEFSDNCETKLFIGNFEKEENCFKLRKIIYKYRYKKVEIPKISKETCESFNEFFDDYFKDKTNESWG